MGKLKVLPTQLANMIAAGEVVQRPASVVKELMENAVDAGADQINVIIEDAGRTLIQVIDNGCGMSPSDAVLCFERHATSKIAEAEDLQDILTYGFRGEALPSIAAVSEVTMKTRRQQDETAVQVRTSGGSTVQASSAAAPAGTNIAIRNLFFNTPARRKFLKSENVEFRHIVEEFTRIAITRPDTAFTLTHNGRDIHILRKDKSLKYRIVNLLGNSVISDVVDLESDTASVSIRGFVGRPDTARKTAGNQFFFVNGRFFKSAYLHKAVMKAYEGMIPDGVTPSYFIFLDIDPHSIDVNVHPTKAEIKFEDDSVIFQTLFACVRETLGRNSFGASIDFDTEGAVDLPQLSRNFGEYLGQQPPGIGTDPGFDPFNMGAAPQHRGTGASASPRSEEAFAYSPFAGTDFKENGLAGNTAPEGPAHAGGWSGYAAGTVDRSQDYGKLFEQRGAPASRTLAVQGRYIITTVASGIMVVHISRARERIMYDRTIRALADNRAHFTQKALFPVELELGVDGVLVIEGHRGLLENLGFDIHKEDESRISVSGVPEGYSCEAGKVETLVRELVYILSEEGNSLQEIMNQRLAEKIAATSIIGADPVESSFEAQRIIDTLFASDNAEFTSNGRRIISIVSIGDIDKMF